MKKTMTLILLTLTLTGCTTQTTPTIEEISEKPNNNLENINAQDTTQAEVNSLWLIDKLKDNFGKHGLALSKIKTIEVYYGEIEIVGFKNNDLGIELSIYDNHHEVLGTDKEFAETIQDYSNETKYATVILENKKINDDINLQYTKNSVMNVGESFKKEYFFNLQNGDIVKAKIVFPIYLEDESYKNDLVKAKVDEISEILLSEI